MAEKVAGLYGGRGGRGNRKSVEKPRLKLEWVGGGKEGWQVDYRGTPPEQSGGARASLIGVTLASPADEPLSSVEREKRCIRSMSAGGITRPRARGGGGLGSGDAHGCLSGSARRKGGEIGRERVFDAHACSAECGTLAENPGHRHRSLFSHFDRRGFGRASLVGPAQKRRIVLRHRRK